MKVIIIHIHDSMNMDNSKEQTTQRQTGHNSIYHCLKICATQF